MANIQIFWFQQLFLASLFSSKTSLPVKNSSLLTFRDDKAETLAVCWNNLFLSFVLPDFVINYFSFLTNSHFIISSYYIGMDSLMAKLCRSLKMNMGLSQPAADVWYTSPKGTLKVLMSGTNRGSSGGFQRTNEKIDNLTIMLHFGGNSSYITYLFLHFIGGANNSKS